MLSSWLGVTEELAATPFLSSEELQICLQQLFFSYANIKLYCRLLYVTVNNWLKEKGGYNEDLIMFTSKNSNKLIVVILSLNIVLQPS